MRWGLVWMWALLGCGDGKTVPPDAPPPAPPTITAFSFGATENPGLPFDISATISQSSSTIRASTDFGGNVVGLKASFVASGVVTVDGVEQISGVTAQDFTSPRVYTVTADTGATAVYTVTVHVPAFADAVEFTTAYQPYGIALGDLDGDGKPDLVVASIAGDVVQVRHNTTATGAAIPTFSDPIDLAVAGGPDGVALADLNHDGKVDIIVAGAFSNTMNVLINQTSTGGALAFATNTPFPAGSAPHSVTAGDLDGDGAIDVVSGSYSTESVSVFWNTTSAGSPTATFATRMDVPANLGPESIAFGDFNRDSMLDLAVANSSASTVSILLATGVRSFGSAVPMPAGQNPFSIGVGDFDIDGDLDVAAADYGNPMQPTTTVSVLANTTTMGATTASFAAPLMLGTTSPPHALVVDDVSGDGKPDIIAANAAANLSVYLDATDPGASALRFFPMHALTTSQGPWAITTGDVNGDGKTDLAAVCFGSTSVASVILAK